MTSIRDHNREKNALVLPFLLSIILGSSSITLPRQLYLPIMPRAKRTLAETEPNAEAVAPVAKRTSTGKAQEKENDESAAAKKGGKSIVFTLLSQWILEAEVF